LLNAELGIFSQAETAWSVEMAELWRSRRDSTMQSKSISVQMFINVQASEGNVDRGASRQAESRCYNGNSQKFPVSTSVWFRSFKSRGLRARGSDNPTELR